MSQKMDKVRDNRDRQVRNAQAKFEEHLRQKAMVDGNSPYDEAVSGPSTTRLSVASVASAALDKPTLPPLSEMYDSFDELMSFLQAFHRENGAPIRIKRNSDHQIANGERIPTYYTLGCDRSGHKAFASAGI
ncbi:hypothetical protein ACHAQJ_000239 [Trichoderma viride]